MRFQPKTEDEIREENLLPDGEYDFEVVKAEDKVSKKGNEMLKIQLKVFGPNGNTPFVFDYLLEAFLEKLLHFCKATGLSDAYERGELSASLVEKRCGKVELYTEKQEGYAARNAVKDYVVDSTASFNGPTYPKPGTSSKKKLEELDDIPF